MSEIKTEIDAEERRKHRFRAAAFLFGVSGDTRLKFFQITIFTQDRISFAGISAVVGFARTVAMAKKSDPNFFNKGVAGSKEMAETGASLAMRALGWGSLFAVMGTGSLAFAIWKLSGAKDVSLFEIS